jgi:DNA-binding CsgD family transcriptional regulator
MALHPAHDADAPGHGSIASRPAPDASDDADPRAERALSGVLFLAIATLIGLDVFEDVRAGSTVPHVGLETAVLLLALVGAVVLWRRFRSERRRARRLRSRLSEVDAEAQRWRRDAETALRGLGEAIDAQFGRWGLTAAEREIGLLLLKGLSLREVAGVRVTSERTVRQQALAVYRKAGVSGRAELSAFFLEDLLLPAASLPVP